MKRLLIIVLSCCVLCGCEKGFLEVKPKQELLVPSKLSDLQALLDNSAIMNVSPVLNLIADDDAYVTVEGLSTFLSAPERNLYLWKENPYEGAIIYDWRSLYQQIFYANVVLDHLKKISDQEETQLYNQIKGSALFFRALGHYNLAQQFCKAYGTNAENDLGIPIRLTSNINDSYDRGSLAQTYRQIISDFSAAKELLPSSNFYKSRPSKGAALALLAKVSLSVGSYQEAKVFANQCLELNGKLIDFNLLPTNNAPFPETLPFGNNEVIFFTNPVGLSFVGSSQHRVDTLLYQSYDVNDLRRQAFFRVRAINHYTYKGYQGVATPEIYLIRAEVNARDGKVQQALDDLNFLLKSRWKAATTFIPLNANSETILNVVLDQRRKELVQKGLRWFDLKRLNTNQQTQTRLTRIFNGQTFVLNPGDIRYVFPIPDEEVLTAGLLQN